MDSHNPQQREYHSPSASRQDATHAASSSPSAPHAPTYADPPTSYQATHAATSAPADVADQVVDQVVDQRAPLPAPDDTDAGSEEDDGPVTVPVLGIQPPAARGPMSQPTPGNQMIQDIPAAWPVADDNDDNDNNDDNNRQNAGTYQDVADDGVGALDMLDPDIALGFGGEPLLRDDAFAFRERSWDTWKRTRRTALTLLALTAMIIVAILGATFAASYMQHATQGLSIAPAQPTVSSYSGGLVIQGPESIAPTPEAPKYQIGAWMSNNAPSGGTVKVFVRLTENVKPLAHVPVTLAAQVPGGVLRYGPTKTDGYGLATFTVRYGGLSGTPVFVTASAKVGGQTFTADTVFVPI